HGVQVDAKDTPACDLPAKKLCVLDRLARPVGPEVIDRHPSEACQFLLDIRERALRKVADETPLNSVDSRNEKMPGAHGDVRDPELEEPAAGFTGWHAGQPVEMFIQCRFQGMVEEMFNSELLGVVGTGGLAGSGTVVKIDLTFRDYDIARCISW